MNKILVTLASCLLTVSLSAQIPNCGEPCEMKPVEAISLISDINVLAPGLPIIGNVNTTIVPNVLEFVDGKCKPSPVGGTPTSCVPDLNCGGNFDITTTATIPPQWMVLNSVGFSINNVGKIELFPFVTVGVLSKGTITVKQACGETSIIAHQWTFTQPNGQAAVGEIRTMVRCSDCPSFVPPMAGMSYNDALTLTRTFLPTSSAVQETGLDLRFH